MKENELKRIEMQRRIDSQRSSFERNKLGQYATPPDLARQIASYILSMMDNKPIGFLDPAVGSGAFFSALMDSKDNLQIDKALGIEIDAQFAIAASEIWSSSGLEIEHADFTKMALPVTEKEKFNLILTNPPYVRHHHIDAENKERLKQQASAILGFEISGLAGLYCYFLLLTHNWLKKNAISSWLIPSEFMDVNYGIAIKRYLLEQVQLLHIHRYDPVELQFEDALVSSAVVVFQNKKPDSKLPIKFSFGGPIENPNRLCEVSAVELAKLRKWTSFPTRSNKSLEVSQTSLADFFTIRRGIATGANGFFILPRSRAMMLGIEGEFLKPLLPSPRKLLQTIVESESDGYPQLPDQLTLIDTCQSEDYIKKSCPVLYEYLKDGKKNGITNTYLVSKRKPWYKQEQREPAPFLCTYMGRSVKNKPFRFIWNKSQAIATNTYLMLYPVPRLAKLMHSNHTIAERIFDFLNNIDLDDLVTEGRIYGGGLHKVEPAELGRVDAEKLISITGVQPLEKVTQLSFV